MLQKDCIACSCVSAIVNDCCMEVWFYNGYYFYSIVTLWQ